MSENYKEKVLQRMLDSTTFVRAMFTGVQKGAELAWLRVVIRPVEIQGEVQLQFSHFDEKKDITKNYPPGEVKAKIEELLALPFRNIFVESKETSLQINISKKGKAVVSERKNETGKEADLAHNRRKNHILSEENAKPFLEAIGMLTTDGRIKADMQRKFKQINEFLRLVDETGSFRAWGGQPIHVVDFGCGSAHLTFAMYYYLRNILGLDAHVTGVDLKADLMERHNRNAQRLGWEGLSFKAGTIADYESETKADVVLALHACDTATDDALAKGIQWESKVIVCAPCCQHELQEQLSHVDTPAEVRPMMHHGILFERVGDILTDSFRAAILRIAGYHTDVTEFIPIEHTGKNLMIRAVKTANPERSRWLAEYNALKSFWKVTPYLEKILDTVYF